MGRIEVHVDDGYGARARSLTERRAAQVKQWLEREGLASGRVVAVGRGSSVPLVPNIGRRNRERNRRVDVYAHVPGHHAAGDARTFAPKVTLTGAKGLAPDAGGRFHTTLAMPGDGELVLGIRRADGATFGAAVALDAEGKPADLVTAVDASGQAREVHLEALPGYRKAAAEAAGGWVGAPAVTLASAEQAASDGASASAKGKQPGTAGTVTIAVRLPASGAPALRVAGQPVAQPLLGVGAHLRGHPVIRLGRHRRPARPLEFETTAPAQVSRWALVVTDTRGRRVGEASGKGAVPARVHWTARDRHGRGVLRPGAGYLYHLEVDDGPGDTARSPAHGFAVEAGATGADPARALPRDPDPADAPGEAGVGGGVGAARGPGRGGGPHGQRRGPEGRLAGAARQAAQVARILEADGVPQGRGPRGGRRRWAAPGAEPHAPEQGQEPPGGHPPGARGAPGARAAESANAAVTVAGKAAVRRATRSPRRRRRRVGRCR